MTEQNSCTFVSPLAQALTKDSEGEVRDKYCAAFEELRTRAAANMRGLLSPTEYEVNQAMADVADLSIDVVNNFWGRCHRSG